MPTKRKGKMFAKLKAHPAITVIGATGALVGIIVSILSLTEPKYATVTDSLVCGSEEEKQTTRPHRWKECRNPTKEMGYKFTEIVSKSSGWVGRGKDPNWHCTNVKREKERAVRQSIKWSHLESSEESRKEWGKVTYKYHCTLEAKWGPIYKIERWEGCGEAEPVIISVQKPRTCIDENQRIGWKWKWE